ncbi:MAG: type IV toxin-antitoxin system AbiEi family antitoxin domain-containing protein [Cellulomonas sp.]
MPDAAGTVSRLAAGQWGLLTTAQARGYGISRDQLNHLVNVGVLERVEHGVYATTAVQDEHRSVRVAWLVLAPALTAEERLADPAATGVVSHTSAAALHRLGDLLDDVPEVTVAQRKQTRRPMRVHHLPLTSRDITLVDGLPVTTPERTVADLIRDGHDRDHIARLTGDGLTRGVIDLSDLARQLEPVAHRIETHDGRAAAARLVEIAGLDVASLLRTPAGQDLVTIGWSSAIQWILDAAEPSRPHVDDNTTAAQRRDERAPSPAPDIPDALRNSPAVRAAIDAARSPQVRATLEWLNSPAGRETARATQTLRRGA